YLEAHYARQGYAPIKDMYYWRLSNIEGRVEALRRRRPAAPLPDGFAIRKFDMKNLKRDLGILREVFNDAWSANWGFVPLQPEEVEAVASEMKPFVKPEYGIIMHDGDLPAAVAMILPNIYEITADLGPEPSPFGWLKLGWRALTHRFQTGFVLMLGISRRYQKSVGGAVIAMKMVDEIITRMLPYEDKSGWLEAGWVLDDNTPLQKILKRQGFETKRQIRLFSKDIAEFTSPEQQVHHD
ncbi:MAG: hypothetical protein KKH72_11325, partial [Alphaproteobacteria bacterium]|nr:hypothetical protein [Alphaproteobacteria bacterium]